MSRREARAVIVVQARCRFCLHEEQLAIGDLLLVTPADPSAPARVVFDCEGCLRRTSTLVDHDVADMLEARGIRVVHGHPSSGPAYDPGPRPDGPAFTYDDLLDLHLLLDQPDWFERLRDTVA